jgi:hypothetical protein
MQKKKEWQIYRSNHHCVWSIFLNMSNVAITQRTQDSVTRDEAIVRWGAGRWRLVGDAMKLELHSTKHEA